MPDPQRPSRNTSSRQNPDIVPGPDRPQDKKPSRPASGPPPVGEKGTRLRPKPVVVKHVSNKTGIIVIASAFVAVIGGIAAYYIATRPTPPVNPTPIVDKTPKPTVEPTNAPDPIPSPSATAAASPTATSKPVPPPKDERGAFLAGIERARVEGLKKVEEARKAVKEQVAGEKKAEAEFSKQFAGARREVKLVSGQSISDAAIVGFSMDALTVEREKGKPQTIVWNLIAPESQRDIARHVYRRPLGSDKFELGRFFILRRLWKDAEAALREAGKIDEEVGIKADEILEAMKPLLTEKGLFQAAFQRIPPNGLQLTYDFADVGQADDWRHRDGDGELIVGGGRMTLTAKDHADWACSNIEFVGEVDVKLQAAVTDGTFRMRFHRVYSMDLGPTGAQLRKYDRTKGNWDTVLAKNEFAKPDPAGQKIRLLVRGRKIQLYYGENKQIIIHEDTTTEKDETEEPRDALCFGVEKGSTAISGPLVIGGQLDPSEIEKRFATMEMLVQRAINPELEMIDAMKARRQAQSMLGSDSETLALSADGYFEFNVKPKLTMQEVTDYQQLKRKFTEGHRRGEKLEDQVEKLVKAHPDFPQGWYLKGIQKLTDGDPAAARKEFAKAIELFPEFSEAHLMMGMSWYVSRDFASALVSFEKAIELKPDNAQAWCQRAESLFAKDKSTWEQAEIETRIASHLGADAFEVNTQRRWIQVQHKGPRELGAVFEFESPNYLIVTDISNERAKWYAERLEIVRARYLERFKQWHKGDPRPKPRIAIFNTREAFYTYAELSSTERHENALGFFAPQNHELVLFEDVNIIETEETLYHEAFHHFASAFLPYPPYWWNEGIAEYMSAVRIDQGKIIEEARVLRGRLGNLKMGFTLDDQFGKNRKKTEKEEDEPDIDDEEFREMFQFIQPFDAIMTQPPRKFYSGQVGMKYAQAWSMVHFLYEAESGKHRPLIEQYVTELVAGKSQQEAFDAVFKGKTEDLQKSWTEYAKKLQNPKTP